MFQQRSQAAAVLRHGGPGAAAAPARSCAPTCSSWCRPSAPQPDDDLLSGLVHHDGEDRLDDEELTSIGLLLLVAGHETTANMLGLGTLALLSHPDQLERLRADPGLVESAVEELLRYLTIVQFGLVRVALEDVELERPARSGPASRWCSRLPAANRDPAHFPDPDRPRPRPRAAGAPGLRPRRAPVPGPAAGPGGDADRLLPPARCASRAAAGRAGGAGADARRHVHLRRRGAAGDLGHARGHRAQTGNGSGGGA